MGIKRRRFEESEQMCCGDWSWSKAEKKTEPDYNWQRLGDYASRVAASMALFYSWIFTA